MHFTPEQLDTMADIGIFRPSGFNDDKRIDITGHPFIALDGRAPSEIDDAVRVIRRKHGGFVVQVAIADGAQVSPGQFLEQAIAVRHNRYKGRRLVEGILPRMAIQELELSGRNNPQRATVVSETFSSDAQSTGEIDIFPALISVNALRLREFSGPYLRSLGEQARHNPIIAFDRAFRIERGMNYRVPEVLGGNMKGESFVRRLVQTYMVLTNHTAAEWAFRNGVHIIYRVYSAHRHASQRGSICSRPGRYTSETDFHFGVDESNRKLWMHTHFTSPLRRAVDLINHIQTSHLIAGLNLPFSVEDIDNYSYYFNDNASFD